jgi:hypothetical protein
MTLAFAFATPLLLVGLLAAAIPPLLHLLSNVRAKEVPFPTLRFLRRSMEKTARRRRIQHWLLLVLRSALLAALVIGVAEPISAAAGSWLWGRKYSAVIILDNSMSMSAKVGASARLAAAKSEVAALLSGPNRPELAAVMTTNDGPVPADLTTRLDRLRKDMEQTAPSFGQAPLAQRLQEALALLTKTQGARSVYLFSDLQKLSFDPLTSLKLLPRDKDLGLMVVNTAAPRVDNVGIADLQVVGRKVRQQVVEINATLVNSSPGEHIVDVTLTVDVSAGEPTVRKTRATLAPSGQAGCVSLVQFLYRLAEGGTVTGRVAIEQADDLAADNVRHFSLTVAPYVPALIVQGAAEAAGGGWLSAGATLRLALDPYGQASAPWSIKPRLIDSSAFSPGNLTGAHAAFFCNVPAFDDAQASAIAQFVRDGGTAVFFLGPDARAEAYNQLAAGPNEPLLPARIQEQVGQVGPDAPAVAMDFVDIEHPFFANLYEERADYLTVLVQRRFRLSMVGNDGHVLMRLADGSPLLASRSVGKGNVILCATSASPKWSNLPLTGLFLPMVSRISLLSGRQMGGDQTYQVGAQVAIRPLPAGPLPAGAMISVTPPADPSDPNAKPRPASVPMVASADGPVANFTGTVRPGVYRWLSTGKTEASGAFAVNPHAAECDLQAIHAASLKEALTKAGLTQVEVGGSVQDVQQAAAAGSEGRNWWDLVLAMVIFLLVIEAVIANRTDRSKSEDRGSHRLASEGVLATPR